MLRLVVVLERWGVVRRRIHKDASFGIREYYSRYLGSQACYKGTS